MRIAINTQTIKINSVSDIQEWNKRILLSIEAARNSITTLPSDPLQWISSIKFEKLGTHPTDGHPLNFIEQLNQSLTYLVALEATKQLYSIHSGAKELESGFSLAPGANGNQQELDIMSLGNEFIGAECFAAVNIHNNGKLTKDMQKLSARNERHRYVFFASPKYTATEKINKLCYNDIEVWSIAINF